MVKYIEYKTVPAPSRYEDVWGTLSTCDVKWYSVLYTSIIYVAACNCKNVLDTFI
jgi:hypothetical protein